MFVQNSDEKTDELLSRFMLTAADGSSIETASFSPSNLFSESSAAFRSRNSHFASVGDVMLTEVERCLNVGDIINLKQYGIGDALNKSTGLF